MSPIESADVVIENLPGDTSDTTIINKHQFTEAVGYIAFARSYKIHSYSLIIPFPPTAIMSFSFSVLVRSRRSKYVSSVHGQYFY